jgi:hypothetical protein
VSKEGEKVMSDVGNRRAPLREVAVRTCARPRGPRACRACPRAGSASREILIFKNTARLASEAHAYAQNVPTTQRVQATPWSSGIFAPPARSHAFWGTSAGRTNLSHLWRPMAWMRSGHDGGRYCYGGGRDHKLHRRGDPQVVCGGDQLALPVGPPANCASAPVGAGARAVFSRTLAPPRLRRVLTFTTAGSLLDNEIKILEQDSKRINGEKKQVEERIKENNEKIKLNKQVAWPSVLTASVAGVRNCMN